VGAAYGWFMRADLKRRRRAEEDADLEGAKPEPHALLALQAGAGNAAVTRMLARTVKPGDTVAMKTWGKTTADQRLALIAMGPDDATAAIKAFCKSKDDGKRKDPPTFAEVRTHLGLTATQAPDPVAAAAVVQGWKFAMDMINRTQIEVGFDDHQNKHQIKKIFGLKDYSGGDADNKYGPTKDAAWHKTNTATLVFRWAAALKQSGALDPVGTIVSSSTGEEFFGSGHLFVASAIKASDGIVYASYHCYPEKNEGKGD
jgi:hypothetical protein